MEFKQGDFQKLRATSGIHLGALRDPANPSHIGSTVPENGVIEFDGTTVKFGALVGESPNIKGAVKSGWFVPVADTTSTYKAQPAGVRVHPATSQGSERGDETTMGAATEEQHVVGSLKDTNKKRQESIAERVAMAQEARAGARPSDPPVTVGPSRMMEEPTVKVGSTEPLPIEAPDGSMVTVGSAEPTPVQPRYPLVNEDDVSGVDVGASTKEAAAAKKAAAAEFDATRPSSDGEVVATFKTGTKFATEVSEGSQAASVVRDVESGPPKVEKRKPSTHITAEDGEDIRGTHSSGATGDVAEAHSGEDLADLLPGAAQTTVPKTQPTPSPAESFVWDKKAHWRIRISKALEYSKDPAILKKILASEVPSVQGHIKSAMARKGLPLPE